MNEESAKWLGVGVEFLASLLWVGSIVGGAYALGKQLPHRHHRPRASYSRNTSRILTLVIGLEPTTIGSRQTMCSRSTTEEPNGA